MSSPRWAQVATVAELAAGRPVGARVADVDVVAVRHGGEVRVLYGRCTHRNARLADGHLADGALVCAHHGWDYDCLTGRGRSGDGEALALFESSERDGVVWVDAEAVRRWRLSTPLDFLDDELDP